MDANQIVRQAERCYLWNKTFEYYWSHYSLPRSDAENLLRYLNEVKSDVFVIQTQAEYELRTHGKEIVGL